MTAPATLAGESAAVLSRDLADFLIELSIALHKHAIYPPGHPLLGGAVAGVERRLGSLVAEREQNHAVTGNPVTADTLGWLRRSCRSDRCLLRHGP